jgi:hypothetical protein
MSPFQPVGDEPRWRTAYKLLAAAEIDETVTYEALGDALGLHPDDDRHAIQMAVRKAAWEHEVTDNRALDAVPNVGYRIVRIDERIPLARRYQKKAGRSLVRGQSKVEHVDLSGVDPETRRALEVVALAFKMQSDFNRRLDVRQKKLERQVQSAVSAQEHTSDEIADLRERLEKLEADREVGG